MAAATTPYAEGKLVFKRTVFRPEIGFAGKGKMKIYDVPRL
jgi:hypothetical protein